jgi:hypothetical protein
VRMYPGPVSRQTEKVAVRSGEVSLRDMRLYATITCWTNSLFNGSWELGGCEAVAPTVKPYGVVPFSSVVLSPGSGPGPGMELPREVVSWF